MLGKSSKPCFEAGTLSQITNCLKPLIEAYYEGDESEKNYNSFARACTSFSLFIAEANCTGCPWDDRSNALDANSCAVSNVARMYQNEREVRVTQFLPSGVAAFVLSLVLGLSRDVDRRVLKQRYFLGKKWLECLLMLIQWCFFAPLYWLMLRSESYASVCMPPSASYSLYFARVLVSATFRTLSLYQLAFLNTMPPTERKISFISSISDPPADAQVQTVSWRDELRPIHASLFVAFLVLSVTYICFMFTSRLQRFDCSHLCSLRHETTLFGVFQYLRVVLEVACVFFFALGRKKKPGWLETRDSDRNGSLETRDIVRYFVVLVLGPAFSFVMAFFQAPHWRLGSNNTATMLLDGIQDRFVSDWYETTCHIAIIWVMSFLELWPPSN